MHLLRLWRLRFADGSVCQMFGGTLDKSLKQQEKTLEPRKYFLGFFFLKNYQWEELPMEQHK